MKKVTLIVVLLIAGIAVFAGPHHHGGHHGHHRGNDGVWLAAGITSIVANGIQILNGITYPVRTVVVPQPVYQQPVVVPPPAPAVYYPPQPVYTPPVYYQPRVIYTRPMYRYTVPAPVVYRY